MPDWVLEAVSRARALPYPALHVMAVLLALTLLARSLAAMALAVMLVSIAAIVLLAHPDDQRSWTILWTPVQQACWVPLWLFAANASPPR